MGKRSLILPVLITVFTVIGCNHKTNNHKKNQITINCDSVFYVNHQECLGLRFKINYKNTSNLSYLKNSTFGFSSPDADSQTEGFILVTDKKNPTGLILSSRMVDKINLSQKEGSFDLALMCRLNFDSLGYIKNYKILYRDDENPVLINEISLEKTIISKDRLIIK
ncbi:hypothetical protein D3C87_395380 [compost metagenome]